MKGESQLIVCGFSVPPDMPAMRIDGVEVRWTADALRSLNALRAIGEKIDKPELPYRSLAWLAEMGCPGMMLADSSIGLGRKKMLGALHKASRGEALDPIMWIDVGGGNGANDDEQITRLRQLICDWLGGDALNAYFVDIDRQTEDGRVERDIRRKLIGAVEGGRVFELRSFRGQIAPWTRALTVDNLPVPYELLRARVQQILSGQELFPEAGVCRRILTPRNVDYGELITEPIILEEMAEFSLKARLRVVTIPGIDHPILKVEASRVRWANELPDHRVRNSNASGFAFPTDRREVAYRFGISRQPDAFGGTEGRTWRWVPNGDFHEMRRYLRQAPVNEVDDILLQRADAAACQYRISYHNSYGRGGDDIVKSGVPETDRMALMERLTCLLGGHGFKPFTNVSRFSAMTSNTRGQDVQFIQTYGLGLMLESLDAESDGVALDHGALARMSESEIRSALERHVEHAWAEATSVSLPTSDKTRSAAASVASSALDDARTAMADLYPTARPLLVVFHHESEDAFDSARVAAVWAKVLTGDALDIEIAPLPKEVHGPIPFEPGTKRYMSRDKRAALWEAAWRRSGWPAKLAQIGAERPVLCLMIIPQFISVGSAERSGAAKIVRDDHVAKLVTRKVLASVGRATVQYLLPAPSGRPVNFNERLHHVQSALRDLIWAHVGRVDGLAEIASNVAAPAQRPKSIVGVFVQAGKGNLMFSKRHFFLPLATKLDVSTGQCFLSWMLPNGAPAPWTDFREGLFRIAGLEGTSTEERGNARALFQRFVRGVVDSVRADCPLVLIDATHTRNLWTYLTNPKIGQSPLAMDGQDHVTHGWHNVRIVRVDGEIGLRVISRKAVHVELPDGSFDYPYATSDKEFLAVNPDGPVPVFYSVIRHLGYGQPKRGQSCYRSVVLRGEKVMSNGQEPPGLIAKIDVIERTYGDRTKTMCRGIYKYPPIGDSNASLPISVEIVVGLKGTDDDPVAIARMVHQLREAMGHYIDAVKMPPPLFHKRVIKDYAITLELKNEDDEDGESVE